MSAATAESDARKALDRNWLFAGGTLLVGFSGLYADKRRARRNRKRQEDAVDWCFGEDASDEEEPADADTLFDEQEAGAREMIGHLFTARTAAAVALAPPPACGCEDSPLPRAGEGPGAGALGPGKPACPPRVRPKPSATLGGRWWLATCLLIAALFAGSALRGTSSLPLTPQGRPPATRAHQPATQTIETIRVGQRVVAHNPDPDSSVRTADLAVDPATWRLLRLRGEDRWPDGTLDVMEVETLQPPDWVAAHRAAVGAEVPLPLDLLEMGVREDLRAEVIANEPCPPIASGEGCVVLTTVNHLNPNVFELTLTHDNGRRETIQPTGLHKFYSADRRSWVNTQELKQGERLRSIDGWLTVSRVQRLPGVHRVYNMTVAGEHVFHVSTLGLLSHNNSPCGGTPMQTQWGWTGSNSWNKAVRAVERGNEEGIIRGIAGKVPTQAEAERLIQEAGGTIQRIDEAHAAGGVAGHIDFPHINYTTPGGTRMHLEIQAVTPPGS